MELLKSDAEQIVKELSKLIDLKINIIGSDGIIIANSDPKRVGDFHEAAYEMIKNNLDELVVVNNQQYKGSLVGINMPIVIDHKIVGGVGITGPYEVAKYYGKIVKRITEILLQSRAEENKLMREARTIERFYDVWVCSSETVINDAFISQGKTLHIDITQPRRIILISKTSGDNEDIIDDIKKVIQRQNSTDYLFLGSHFVVLVISDRSDDQVLKLSNDICSELAKKNVEVYIGVDNGYHYFTEIHQQYEEAKRALNTGLRMRDSHIIFFNDLDLELILEEISIESKIRYIKKIFRNSSIKEIEHYIKIISVLYEEDGSIKRASKRLIVHPNTLQYQLKKIGKETGYDPRKLKHASIFEIALLFIKELGDNIFRIMATD